MTSPIFELCDHYITRSADLDPVVASMRGIADPTGQRADGTDYGPDGIEARADLMRETVRRLDELTPTDAADVNAAGYLKERLQTQLALHDWGESYRNLRAPFGLLQQVRDSVDLMPKHNDDDWRAVARRVGAIPGMLASWKTSLEVGLDRGLLAARRQATEAALQADRYAGDDGTAPTLDAVVESYGDGPVRDELTTAARAAHSAYVDIARYLRERYAPRASEVDGVGAERFALNSQMCLGADIDAREAYDWGWAELHRIEDELAAEANAIRSGATVDEAVALLGETEYVDGLDVYRGWLQDRHDEAIERLHGDHFDIAEPLRRIEATLAIGSSSGAPYYTGPSEDLSRPGRTWWPLGGRERFETWRELTTVFHEGVPGHHLQNGATRVAGDKLSRFAKFTFVSGHGEGWALYAERLADELGWFTPAGSRLGMLQGSAIRAARVVIDIGLHLDLPLPAAEAARHGDRWTFEVASEVLRTRGGLASHRVHPEIVRYCGWPGQAPSYKLGERAWLAAREEAQTRLGSAFDLKRWHTDALALGPIGLDDLSAALRTLRNE